jgi:hypothetical protein
MGYCQGRCDSTYKSVAISSSQQEESEDQADDLGCHKGSFDPSYIQEEDNKGDVQCPDKSLLE